MPFGVLLGLVAVVFARGLIKPRDLTSGFDAACPVTTTIRDYWREYTAGTTRYGLINGKPTVRPGDVVLDCGAWLGDTAAEALGMGARLVVAIDPSDYAISRLKQNLAAHISAGRVIVQEVAVLDRDGWMELNENPDRSADSLVYGGGKSRRVPVTTIDAIVARLGLERVDLIKMDIEGAEQGALRGARKTIRRFRPRLAIASYHLLNDYETIPQIVREARTDYHMETARCRVAHGRVIPNLLHFF